MRYSRPTSVGMERVGQIFDGRYRLERLLGQGGMAAVYLARDRKLDKTVAVKVLSERSAAVPKSAQRFVQEARAASRVRHPNVVDVTDFGVADDGAAYLVMELVRGEDLARTLDREGPLPWSRVAPIGLQICAALAAAHRVGVIHRDIKPANCIRLHRAAIPDFIKVVDFGIARVLDPRHRVVEPTTAGTVLGTPEYMAPEVAAGAEAGPAADLYAVGALLYKLLTGSPPFVGDTYRAVLSKQIFEAPTPPRRRAPNNDIPEAAEALILRALAKEPADRPPDMAALGAAIADTLQQRPAVELWFAPSASGTLLVDPLPPLALIPDEAATPTPELPLPVTRTLPRPEGGLARTVPLAVQPPPARRWPLALAGVGLVLFGALAWAATARVVGLDGSQDMSQRPGPSRHGATDMLDRAADERADSSAGGPAGDGAARGAGGAAGATNAATGPASDGAAQGAGGPAGDAAQAPGGPAGDGAARSAAIGGGAAGTSAALEPGSHADTAGPAARSPETAHTPGDPTPAAAGADSDATPGAKAGVGERAATSGDSRPAAQPARRSQPSRFDADAARRELARAAAAVQSCALAGNMLRGPIELRVAIGGDGRVAEVTAAPSSRQITPAALACMRRELASVRLEPEAGEVVVAYVI